MRVAERLVQLSHHESEHVRCAVVQAIACCNLPVGSYHHVPDP
jgi:hypothetical protein